MVDRLRQMAAPGDVFHQYDLTGADHPGLPIAGGQLHAGIEIDDVLAPRRWVPRPVMLRLGLTEDDPGGGQPGRGLSLWPLLRPFDPDVSPVRLALSIAIKVVNADAHHAP